MKLFVFFASFYLLLLGADLYTSDGQAMYATSRSLAFDGTLAVQPGLPQIQPGADGRWYSQYDPGLPLLAVPVVWLSDQWAKTQFWHRHAFAAFMILWIPAFASAGAVTSLYYVAGRIYDDRTGLIIALAAGLCTPLWVYSRLFFAEALLTFVITLAFWGAYRNQWVWVGLALGMAIFTRAATVIYLVPLLWLWWRGSGQLSGVSFQQKIKCIGLLLIFPMLAGIGLLYHNWLRSGDPLMFGYGGQAFDTPPWIGALGLLFAPGKSVFLFAPPLIFSVFCWRSFHRREPALAESLLIAVVVALLFYGSWWAWGGGWCWGPRFLLPIIPLWLLPLGEILTAKRLSTFYILHFTLIAGFFINGAGAITDINAHYARFSSDDVVNYEPENSPILGAAQAVLKGDTIPLGVFHLKNVGWTESGMWIFAVILCLGLVSSLSLMIRNLYTHFRVFNQNGSIR